MYALVVPGEACQTSEEWKAAILSAFANFILGTSDVRTKSIITLFSDPKVLTLNDLN